MSAASRKKPEAVRPGHCFLTGFTSLMEKRLAERILRSECSLTLLVEPKLQAECEQWVQGRKHTSAALLTGDVANMHLGLSGDEYRDLCARTTDIFHLTSLSSVGQPHGSAWRVNVDGTRNVLELARDCKQLKRLHYLSSCYVSGDRLGVIAEDELDLGQTLRNAHEETTFRGEMLIAEAGADLPVTIYRPSSIVGDSHTGEIERFEGPFYLGLYWLQSPWAAGLALPGNGVAPLSVVPLDFALEALWQLAQDPRSVGLTFHVVDPQPMSARRAFQLAAEQIGKPVPRFSLYARAAEVLLRLPLIERWAPPQSTAISYVNHLAFYNCRNLLTLLEGTGIQCPPLTSYLPKLTTFFQSYQEKMGESLDNVEDPLDPAPESAVL